MAADGIDLADYLQAVTAKLAEDVEGLATCEPFAGQFGDGETRKVSFRAPAVFVAVLGGKPLNPGTDQVDVDLRVAAYCVSRPEGKRQGRQESTMALAQAVALVAQGAQWELRCLPAELVDMQNLHSQGMDAKSLALWAVIWRQQVRLGESTWAPDPEAVPPTHPMVGHVPRIGLGHEDDYEDVANG